MKKTIILGIDGMDFDLFNKWKEELPNLRSISNIGYAGYLESVYPADSISAWTTIFTGKDPSEHGLLYTINYLDNNKKLDIDADILRGNTFWDYASKSGKRVCIVNPFLAYPPWEVNGNFVSGPVFISGQVDAYPKELLNKYDVPEMGGIVDFPTKKELRSFIDRTTINTNKLAEYGYSLFKLENWDIFFITFLTLDRIKHFLWRYQDIDDPTYPGKTEFGESVKDFYKLFDSIVGKFINLAGADGNIVVISDHGHQRRCYRLFNLNEYLRRNNYLIADIPKIKYFSPKYWIERLKSNALSMISRYDLEDYAARIVKYIPKKSSLKKSTYITNFKTSYAYTDVEFSGKNPSVGVRLNKDRITESNFDLEQHREKLIKELSNIRDPRTNENISLWVKKREEVYSGKFIDRYPDILIQFNPNYGVDFELFGELFVNSTTHKKISGGHTKNGVFFFSGDKQYQENIPQNLTQIFPFIIKLVMNKESVSE